MCLQTIPVFGDSTKSPCTIFFFFLSRSTKEEKGASIWHDKAILKEINNEFGHSFFLSMWVSEGHTLIGPMFGERGIWWL